MTLSPDDVRTLTESTWRSLVADEPVNPAPSVAPVPAAVSSCVHISGEWDGAVTVTCVPSLARDMAETMLGLDAGDARPEDVDDAFGELVNIIGGGLKSLLPGTSTLSLPTVASGDALVFPGSELVMEQAFGVRGEQLVVRVHQRTPDRDSITPTDHSPGGPPWEY